MRSSCLSVVGLLGLVGTSAIAAIAGCSGGGKTSPAASTPSPSASGTAIASAASATPTVAPTIAPPALDDDGPRGAREEVGFSMRYFQKARKAGGNLLVSPASLRDALGVLYLGARGDTAREMSAALDLDRDPAKAASRAKAERASRGEALGKVEFVVANRVWTDRAHLPNAPWTELVSTAFGADAGTIDPTHADDARKTVNAWVAEKTESKIPELLPAGAIDSKTRLVVTNAVFFKARWAFPFSESATKDEPFRVDAKKTVSAPTMHGLETYRFAKVKGTKVLELGYEGSTLSMLLVLPDDPKGLDAVEADLGADTLTAIDKALNVGRVSVSIPRFEFRSGTSANAVLKDLGMKAAFGEAADFSGAWEKKDIHVGPIVQKTFIRVDEKGTEAAAATGVVMRATSLKLGEPDEFKADHPFLFLLRDAKHGRVLFVGRVSDPTSKG